MGSSAAYFLTRDPAFNGTVTVVERDPTYRTASTTLSAASVRQQFSTPTNIAISQFAVEVLRHPTEWFGMLEETPEFDFVEGGYLFLATAAGEPILRANHALQREMGVPVALLDPDQLHARFPWMTTDDLAGGSLGLEGEGWFDAHALMQAFRAAARAQGADYRAGEVTAIDRAGSRVTGVELADGSRIAADVIINAAGPRGGAVAALAGLDLPVVGRKRFVYSFACKTNLQASPLVIDTSGVYFRPDAPNYICGYSPKEGETDPDTLDLAVEMAPFEDRIWPTIARRVPAFESIRLLRAWAGHYEVNTLDHNAVIGPHTDVNNFLFANGFSGHGLQQSPAVGRGLAELIVGGAYRSIDLSPLGYQRVARNEPLRELNVV